LLVEGEKRFKDVQKTVANDDDDDDDNDNNNNNIY
jgi:hypothetical protein